MKENDMVTSAKRAAEVHLQSLQATWGQVLNMDSQKSGVPSAILLFSSSFLFLFFTFMSMFPCCSAHFSLLILGTLGFHALLRLVHHPICTTLHYKLLYSYILSLFVLTYSPALPGSQAKMLLTVLFPLYYHTLTSSSHITTIFSSPVLFFLVCSLLQDSFPNSTLLATFMTIPTIFWTKTKDLNQKLEHYQGLEPKEAKFKNNSKSNEKPHENVIDRQELLQVPELKGLKELRATEKGTSESETEEHEKVILGISHDCRNLLNSLKATLTLLKEEASNRETAPTQDDNLQSAIAISEHLTLLLTNLLDYVKQKNDDTNFLEETKLTSTLEKIWLMMSPNLKKKNLGGSITIKNGTPLNLHLDEHKFMGVLLNLIGNSAKFTDTGHIKINVHWKEDPESSVRSSTDSRKEDHSIGRMSKKQDLSMKKTNSKEQCEWSNGIEQANPVLSKTTFFDLKDVDSISFTKKCFTGMNETNTHCGQSSQGVLVVSVRDTGCGMDDESLKKIFKKYGQVGEDKEKSKLGLGLGLWYTKYLLKKLNGKIDFRSCKNVGTWVKVEIPCRVAQKKREIHQMIRPEVPLKRKQSENTYVFVRENDGLGSLLVTEYIKKHVNTNIQVREIKSLSEILRSDNFRNGKCMLILGENSATRSEILSLKTLKRLHAGQKMSIVMLRESDRVFKEGLNGWDNTEVDTLIKKPLRTAQLDQVVAVVKSFIEKQVASQEEGRQMEETPCVMIVDDDETILLVSQKCLENKGIKCLTAKNGIEAVEAYRKDTKNVRLIIMDSEMPKMNGLDATSAIRKLSNNPDLKIVGLTGDDSEEFRMRAKENGMDKIFIKPLPIDKLLGLASSLM